MLILSPSRVATEAELAINFAAVTTSAIELWLDRLPFPLIPKRLPMPFPTFDAPLPMLLLRCAASDRAPSLMLSTLNTTPEPSAEIPDKAPDPNVCKPANTFPCKIWLAPIRAPEVTSVTPCLRPLVIACTAFSRCEPRRSFCIAMFLRLTVLAFSILTKSSSICGSDSELRTC